MTSLGCETIATWLDGTLDRRCPHPLGEHLLSRRWMASSSVAIRYHEGSDRQAGDTHCVAEDVGRKRLLHREHELRCDWVDIGCEIGEVLLSEPDETTVIDGLVDQRRRHGPCASSARATRLRRERRLRYTPGGDAWRVGTRAVMIWRRRNGRRRSSGRPAARGPDADVRLVSQRGQGELRCGDLVSLRLQTFNDSAPTRTVGPGSIEPGRRWGERSSHTSCSFAARRGL